MQSCVFSIITPVFSVTWSFRNYSNMLIWRNISDYYQCEKKKSQFCCLLTVIHIKKIISIKKHALKWSKVTVKTFIILILHNCVNQHVKMISEGSWRLQWWCWKSSFCHQNILENSYFKFLKIFHNITVFTVFFYQKNAVLVSIQDFFEKHEKNNHFKLI